MRIYMHICTQTRRIYMYIRTDPLTHVYNSTRIKNNKKMFSLMSNLQTYYHFKLDFQKVDQHTGGKWLIHGTKRHKDNQLQSLELPCRIS